MLWHKCIHSITAMLNSEVKNLNLPSHSWLDFSLKILVLAPYDSQLISLHLLFYFNVLLFLREAVFRVDVLEYNPCLDFVITI